jgi:hypothetical protein
MCAMRTGRAYYLLLKVVERVAPRFVLWLVDRQEAHGQEARQPTQSTSLGEPARAPSQPGQMCYRR